MSRQQKAPLRPLQDTERVTLVRLSRSASAPAAQVARARALLAVAEGLSYTIPGKFWCFSQRLNVRFAFACRVGRRAKCCAASEVPWTDRSGVEEFDVHPAKSCKTKSAPGHALVTAAHGGILQGLNCEPRGGWQTRLCRRRLDHQPGIGTEAADATRFVHERPPRRAALVHDLVNVAIEPMGERSTFEEAPYALRRT